MRKLHPSGFSIVELVIIVGFVGVISFTGYTVYSRRQAATEDAATTTAVSKSQFPSPTATDVSEPPAIDSTGDLDDGLKVLDQNNPAANNSDGAQLDSESSRF